MSSCEQAAKADALVDEALDSGLDGSHPITIHAKMLRLELRPRMAWLRLDPEKPDYGEFKPTLLLSRGRTIPGSERPFLVQHS